MYDDKDVRQACVLLAELHAEVDNVTRKYETLQRNNRYTTGHAATEVQNRLAALRRQLYEVHRLIDGLHRRFPESRQPTVLA